MIFSLYTSGTGAGSAFLVIAVTVFVVGFLVSCLMVKEKKISVIYMIDPLGIHQVVKQEFEESDDTDNEGFDLGDIEEATDAFMLGAAGRFDKCMMLTKRVYHVLSGDRILWFGIYASWVHKMMAYTFTTYYWLYMASWT